MSNFMSHAESELEAIGLTENSTDEMNQSMRKHILHMVSEFAAEGHSGFSASYAAGILNKLFKFEPLAPLSGDDSEWNDVGAENGGDPLFQNRRCSHVFKNALGAWDIDGKVFVEANGNAYTNSNSRTPITFPYTPKTEYINVDSNSTSDAL